MSDLLRDSSRRILGSQPEPPADLVGKPEAESQEIEAGHFIDQARRNSVENNLREMLDTFRMYFADVAWRHSDEFLEERYEIEDRDDAAVKLIEDLSSLLTETLQATKLCRQKDGEDDRYGGYKKIALSALNTGNDEDLGTIAMPFMLSLELGSGGDNRRPLRGVLFPVDAVSEAIPAVGPGLPLYVPESVAVEALAQVPLLPLDAADELDRHAKNEIVGVMSCGHIQSNSAGGRDFVVDGMLWGWSQPGKVATIAANKKILGMSMNANAMGRVGEIDGQKVYILSKLQLLGANILQSSKATFKTTNLIAAQSATESILDEEKYSLADYIASIEAINVEALELPSESDPEDLEGEDGAEDVGDTEDIDDTGDNEGAESVEDVEGVEDTEDTADVEASSSKTNNKDKTPMDNDLTDSFKEFADTQLQLSAAMAQNIEVLMADYNNRLRHQQLLEAQAAQHEDIEFKHSLVQEVSEAVVAALQASGSLNLPAQPARKTASNYRTTPIAASAFGDDEDDFDPQQSIQLELAAVNGKIEALEALPLGQCDNSTLFTLMDERRALQAQL